MPLLEEVVEWARQRPWWQQRALARLARGEDIAPEDCAEIARAILLPAPSPPAGGWLAELAIADGSSSDQVRLVSVRDIENVNRLALGQRLTFAHNGLTLVFGHNGSGKSGYARVIQSMLRTRKRSDILPDVFRAVSGDRTATVEFLIADSPAQADLGSPPPVALSRAAFYDEKCGDDYLVTESEVSFRPSPLRLMDDLAHVCAGVRDALAVQLQALDASGIASLGLDRESAASRWLESLTSATSDAEIDENCTTPPGLEQLLAGLQKREASLRSTDPRNEKNRRTRLSESLAQLADHLTDLDARLGTSAADAVATERGEATARRGAATIASANDFRGEPIPGVGGETWRALWDGAVAFSSQHQPTSTHYPPTDVGDLCALCQQPLSEKAAGRMERFRTFMQDTTEARATEAEHNLRETLREIEEVVVVPNSVAIDLEHIAESYADLHARTQTSLDGWDTRRNTLTQDDQPATPPDDSELLSDLRSASDEEQQQAAAVNAETIAEDLADNARQQAEAQSRISLCEAKEVIRAERDRLGQRARIQAARTEAATKGITDKIGDLTRQHVTIAMQDRFSRESDRLGVERVTLRDTRARLGALLHKPDFVGATVSAPLPAVLSEGEQTALGLAGFLTEAYFDYSKSALVFDDPVTSLDHVRRDRVADEIVEFASDRQVIVFTHDVSFTAELKRACDQRGVQFTERCITRGPGRVPGYPSDHHPWSAQDAAQRIDTLRRRVADIRRDQGSWDEEEYGRRTRELAGDMSETWERIISQEIAAQLVKPDTRIVQTRMMKVVRLISEEDEKEFQESYARISKWAPRHDNHPELNYVAPEVSELGREVELIHEWFKRIKSYKK